MSTRPISVLTTLGLLAVVAVRADASSILPPRNLGQLAAASQAVVLAEAGAAESVREGARLVTRTGFVVLAAVAGELAAGQALVVETPGGFDGAQGWMVAGSPLFSPGESYLLFLSADASGAWAPRALSYGVLHRVTGRDGSSLLVPLPESRDLVTLQRPDGSRVEPVGAYRAPELLRSLAEIAEGIGQWDSTAVLASQGQLPLAASTSDAPSGCSFLRFPDPNSGTPLRWSLFDEGGSATFQTQAGGDPSLLDGDAGDAVADALSTWMSVPSTSLSLIAGGESPYQLSCSSGQDMPPMGMSIVLFGDPCNDILDLVQCVGTLAYGGPWFAGTHEFDGVTWNTIQSAFTIVNDGTGCLGAERYAKLLAHELGHGLGLAHTPDPNALMYRYCCNDLTPADASCMQYAYPASTPVAPAALEATDGVFQDRVRVSWSTVPGATSYEIWRASELDLANASFLQALTATSWDDLSALPGESYWYWSRARNGRGAGDFSEPDGGFAALCRAPGPPAITSPATIRSDRPYEVTWTPAHQGDEFLLDEAEDPAFATATSYRIGTDAAVFSHDVAAPRTYHYRVRSLSSCAGSESASAWSAPATTQVIPAGALPRPITRFDFGTQGSPVAPGYARVTPETAYSPSRGFGWITGGLGGRDRGVGSALTRDLNFASSATFRADLPNGLWEVSLVLGDALHAHDMMAVVLQGERVDTVSTEAGQFVLRSYRATVHDSQLLVTLEDLGGSDRNIVVTALTAQPGKTLRFDFGTAGSPLAHAHTQVTPATRYSVVSGHGWLSGAVQARDRGVGSPLDRDFTFASRATFAVDVPNGTYDVTLRLGDAAFGHDEMGITLESTTAAVVTSGAGEIVVETFRVVVGDRQLTLAIEDLGGTDSYATVSSLEVAPVPAGGITAMLPGNVPLELLRVPAGSYLMGSPAGERGRLQDEGPQHAVTIHAALLVARHEVTRAQWAAIMGGVVDGPGTDLPVTDVSWEEIAGPGGFLERLNNHLERTGQAGAGAFRLPSEAEWEWAARAATSTRFSFGDSLGCDDSCGSCQVAADSMWWCGSSGGLLQPAGLTLPNGFGLADLHGNAGEWVSDRWQGNPQLDDHAPDVADPSAPRSRRGGAFDLPASACRSAARDYAHPSQRAGDLGFRIVLDEAAWLADAQPGNLRLRRRP